MSVLSKNPRDIHDACKEAVVDSLLNNLSARLAGRDEFYSTVYAAKPSATLASEFLLPMPLEERRGDEEADPILLSAHGLDFQLARSADRETLRVRLSGSVYVRVLPSEVEIAPGGVLKPTFQPTKEAKKELKKRLKEALDALRRELGMERRGSRRHPDWAARSLDVRRKVHEHMGFGFDNTLDRTQSEAPDSEASAGPESGTAAVSGEEEDKPDLEVHPTPEMPDALAEPMTPPAKWWRLDLELPGFDFSLASVEEDAKKASQELNESTRAQLEKWANSADEAHGGRLWGFRHGAEMRPSDLLDWQRFLRRVRESDLKIALPKIEMRWVVQVAQDPADLSRTTVHVALENWSEPLTAVNRKEVETAFFGVRIELAIPRHAHRPLRLDRVKPSYRYNQYLAYPALGFNGAVTADAEGDSLILRTTWSPRYVLPRIVPAEHSVEQRMAELAKPDCLAGLEPLLVAYEQWLREVEKHPVNIGPEGPLEGESLRREKEQLQLDVLAWKAECEAIACGIAILKKSREHWSGPGAQKSPLGIPFEAWVCMNLSMAEVARRKGYTEWRLFQLAFILASIPAFATRIPAFHDFYKGEVARTANAVTLLYFATGGGKSEAFLGLLLFVLFLDRLRGKHHGVSALMRYPLRLLTLQQARRTFAAMGAAESVRYARGHPGEAFSLGFWVGSSNTPNWHSDEGYSDVPTVQDEPPGAEDSIAGRAPYKGCKERWLKLDSCPFCLSGKLALRRATPREGGTLGHYCTSPQTKCSWNARFDEPTPLPFYIVDEDIYDLAPSVLLGTVDKLAALGQSQGTIRKFFGLFGFAPLIEKDTERLLVPRWPRDWEGEPGTKTRPLFPSFASGEKRFFDPFPSLLIQDEAHLLDESLGTFAGLFESALEAAFDELAPLLSGQLACEPDSTTRRRIKVIAASATVNEPQRQMRNLYQREHTVQFPHPGPSLYESFYARPKGPDDSDHDGERRALSDEDVELRSHWARVYGAILTNGHRHTVAMASVLSHFHLLVTSLYERLRSGEEALLASARKELEHWVSPGPLAVQHRREILQADAATLLTLVDLHRISLTYVTNKKGGDQVIDTEKTQFEKLHAQADLAEHTLAAELISGAVSAAQIQEIVRRAETRVPAGQPFPHLNETLRSIIATSAVSHGVDVEEFNAMFFAGMPSDIAEYIQASSRAGRTHVGFSLLVPVPQRYRDRFIVEVHDIFHRFLERMILPAAVDRWAEKALVRVMPSFFQEYVCGVNGIQALCEAEDSNKRAVPIYNSAIDARDFLNRRTALERTERFIATAIGLDVALQPDGAAYYRALVKDQLARYREDFESDRLVNGTWLGRFFELRDASLRPMTSLRDVDMPGVLHESQSDAWGKRVPEGATARAMQFIRRGSGADVDDIDARREGREATTPERRA